MDRQMDQLRREFENILESIAMKYVGQLNGWAKLARFFTLLTPEKRREIVVTFCRDEKSENRKLEPKNQKLEPENMDKSEIGAQNIKGTENSNPEEAKEVRSNPEKQESKSNSKKEGPENSNSKKENANLKNEEHENSNSKKEKRI